MSVLLLVMLVPFCFGDEVCFNFTNYNMNISIRNSTILDKPKIPVTCLAFDVSCLMLCEYAHNVSAWFNDSYECLEATVIPDGDKMDVKTRYSQCMLYPCKNATIAELIDSLSKSLDGLTSLHYIRNSCKFLFHPESIFQGLRKSYVKKEKEMIHSIIEASTSDGMINYDLKDVSINTIRNTTKDLDIKDSVKIDAAQLPQMENHIPDIWLPAGVLHAVGEKNSALGTVSYMPSDQFEFGSVNISSLVIRIELLEGIQHQNLNPPVEIVWKFLRNDEENYTFVCHYFDEKESLWLKGGCETKISADNHIICSCNHLTPFAVLLINAPIDEVHWKILSVLSYIGCGLSAFFTALSIVIFFFSQRKKSDQSISIHVSLSGALFLLNTTFLLTEWGAQVKPAWVCVLVAAVLHYSLMCSFTWMALEAVHLYLLLIKVFNTNYKRYMLKLSVAGWGIPAVIVSISVAVKENDFYGLKETMMSDSSETGAICWITDDTYFYAVNLVYFTVIFMFNSGILMAVASSICKMKQVFKSTKPGRKEKSGGFRDSARFSESCKSGLTVLGLTCLMGTTWGLAFLGSGHVNYPILYLFCILNSIQGFFIFLWIWLSIRKQQMREQEEKMTSTVAKTSTTKTE